MTDPSASTATLSEDRGRSLRRAATLTAAVGAVHAVLFLLGFILLAGAPGVEATDEEIYAYYSSPAGRLPSLGRPAANHRRLWTLWLPRQSRAARTTRVTVWWDRDMSSQRGDVAAAIDV